MKYQIFICTHEWEIIAENFDFEKFFNDFEEEYDHTRKLGLTREAWNGDIPLYLHDIGTLSPDYLIEIAKGIVTEDAVFSIFDKENITFEEMVNEIWTRRREIVQVTDGDENPYE
jgi:hypothetical protein